MLKLSAGICSFFKQICFFTLLMILFFQCTSPKINTTPLTSVVMMTTLVHDSAIYHLYDSLHSKGGIWPSIKKANQLSGIQEIQIYRYEDKVVMEYSYPTGADAAKMDSLYISADSSVLEWGKIMSTLQRALPGVDTTQKWVVMKKIHHYKNGIYLQ